MAVTVQFFNKFLENVGEGNINLSTHTFKIILVNNYTFDATDENKSDIGAVEIANGNGYTTDGATIGSISWGFVTDKTIFDGNDVTWTATGGDIGPADGAVIYSDTSTGDKLVCYIGFGQDETAGQDTDFKITFNANGIFNLQVA